MTQIRFSLLIQAKLMAKQHHLHLQQPHQHVALAILSTEEHRQHLNVANKNIANERQRSEPIDGAGQGEVTQARGKVVVGFATEGFQGQPRRCGGAGFKSSLSMLGHLNWLFSKSLINTHETSLDQRQLLNRIHRKHHRPRNLRHG